MFLALEIMGFYLKLLLNLMALSPPISSIIELIYFFLPVYTGLQETFLLPIKRFECLGGIFFK